MGGVVIKKAFLLARHNPHHHALATRVHSMFFLGTLMCKSRGSVSPLRLEYEPETTPHYGADSATLLRRLLKLSVIHNEKSFVGDLEPNSATIQSINDEFRNACRELTLWSFFEGQGSMAPKKSAILDLPGEHQQHLDADHRRVCKFSSSKDSNYLTLRNAFALAIDSAESTLTTSRRSQHTRDMSRLSRYLGVEEHLESDLAYAQDKRVQGSCQWLAEKQEFQDWYQGSPSMANVFWLQGDPGTGKSILTGYIVDHLRANYNDCLYFFFKHGDSAYSTAAKAVCHLAWQMANCKSVICKKLLVVWDDGEHLDRTDARSLLRSLIRLHVFEDMLDSPCLFVLDALDECRDVGTLIPLLALAAQQSGFRLFVTSRRSTLLERTFVDHSIFHVNQLIDPASILADIELLVRFQAAHFSVEGDESRESLVTDILRRSEGNFLWTSLVLDELVKAVSEQHIQQILDSVPKEMSLLYDRILRGIDSQKYLTLASVIFRWVVCAVRPLTAQELGAALEYDVGETLRTFEKSVGVVSGNLVFVDGQSRVRLRHSTLREYLLTDCDILEFSLSKEPGHLRLAEVLLDYLASKEMSVPRHAQRHRDQRPARSQIAQYATTYFTEHVLRAWPQSSGLVDKLSVFLTTNALAWLELVGIGGDTVPVFQAAKNLKSCLDFGTHDHSSKAAGIQIITTWVNDLIHVAAQYGTLLCSSPSSVYSLIPQLCPPTSAIASSALPFLTPLRVVGPPVMRWDDRLLSEVIETGVFATCVAAQGNRFAVGLVNGRIDIYNDSTSRPIESITHRGGVRHLRFANSAPYLLSSGNTILCLWDLNDSKLLWTRQDLHPKEEEFKSIRFDDLDRRLLCSTDKHRLILYTIPDGELISCVEIPESQIPQRFPRPKLDLFVLSPQLNLALYATHETDGTFNPSHKVFVLSLEESSSRMLVPHQGVVLDRRGSTAIEFNPNEDFVTVAVQFTAGHLATFNPCTRKKIAEVPNIFANTLAASPDGRLLASGSWHGHITIFDFETLRVLYRASRDPGRLDSLSFNATGTHLLETRGDVFTVWEPPVLVGRLNGANGPGLGVSNEKQMTTVSLCKDSAQNLDHAYEINDLVALSSHKYVVCGRRNGSVAAYSTMNGNLVKELFRHRQDQEVWGLACSEACPTVASLGYYDLQVCELVFEEDTLVGSRGHSFNTGRRPVWHTNMLFSPTGRYLLLWSAGFFSVNLLDLSKHSEDRRDFGTAATQSEYWNLPAPALEVFEAEEPKGEAHAWVQHPDKADVLILVTRYIIMTFSWDIGAWLTTSDLQPGGSPIPGDTPYIIPYFLPHCPTVCLEIFIRHGPKYIPGHWFQSVLLFGSTRLLSAETPQANLEEGLADIIDEDALIIGMYQSRIIFRNKTNWICSVDFNDDQRNPVYTKHFWVPFTRGRKIFTVNSAGSVIVTVNNEIVLFHRGLETGEKVSMERP